MFISYNTIIFYEKILIFYILYVIFIIGKHKFPKRIPINPHTESDAGT